MCFLAPVVKITLCYSINWQGNQINCIAKQPPKLDPAEKNTPSRHGWLSTGGELALQKHLPVLNQIGQYLFQCLFRLCQVTIRRRKATWPRSFSRRPKLRSKIWQFKALLSIDILNVPVGTRLKVFKKRVRGTRQFGAHLMRPVGHFSLI